MAREYEIVSHSQFRHLNVFLVQMISRTPHIHREIELGLVLDGRVLLQIGENGFGLSRGDMYLVNPFDAHEFVSEGDGALLLSIQLSPRLMESFLSEPPGIRFSGSSRLRDHFEGREERFHMLWMLCIELAHAYLGRLPDFEYQCFSMVAQLLHRLKRDIPNQNLSLQDYLPMQNKTDRILSVTNYIEENFTHKLLLEDVARREGVSMPYLSHLFKDTLGISFQDYLKEKRFEYACNLIATTQRKILDISISSGFSDVRYLTKLFQERFGCTPREYRKGEKKLLRKTASPLESSQQLLSPQEGLSLLTPIREEARKKIKQMTPDMIWQ